MSLCSMVGGGLLSCGGGVAADPRSGPLRVGWEWLGGSIAEWCGSGRRLVNPSSNVASPCLSSERQSEALRIILLNLSTMIFSVENDVLLFGCSNLIF